jgi:hypothetical protein
LDPAPASHISPFSDVNAEDIPAPVDVTTEREGLPRNYRMRADRHYVDQLAQPAAGQPVRMIAVAQIDGETIGAESDLRPLIESIRTRGIVHPLLLRRRDTRFVVVAGHKRLAAAHTLRLATVPCIVHDFSGPAADTQAAALAEADNLRVGHAAPENRFLSEGGVVQRLMAAHLAAIRGCLNMSVDGSTTLNRAASDLLTAHAWRATQLLRVIDPTASANTDPDRQRSIASIVDEVIDGFAAESRLCGVVVRADIREAISSSGLNHTQIVAGLTGAVIAMLPIVERVVRPTVIIRASNTGAAGVSLEVVQTDARVAPGLAARFFDDDGSLDRPGGYTAMLGALAAKAVAEAHGGAATFEAANNGGRLEMTLMRRS